MAKVSKINIIKKIIDLNPENPGTITDQFITKKNGKALGPYPLFQGSINGKKISVRVPAEDVDEVKDYIKHIENKNKLEDRKIGKLLSTYMDSLGDIKKTPTLPPKK